MSFFIKGDCSDFDDVSEAKVSLSDVTHQLKRKMAGPRKAKSQIDSLEVNRDCSHPDFDSRSAILFFLGAADTFGD